MKHCIQVEQEDEAIFHFHEKVPLRQSYCRLSVQFMTSSQLMVLQCEGAFEAHRSPGKLAQDIFMGNLMSNPSVFTSVFKLVELHHILHVDMCSTKIGTPG